MIQEAEYYKAEDEKFLRKATTMNDLDYYIYKIGNALNNEDIVSKLCSQEKEDISSTISRARDLLDVDGNIQQDEIVDFEYCLKELINIFERLTEIGNVG
uniref:Heat shock 70 kDa protein n=1 Tax=Cajanus cajan TaxID=3821 RepID=A0A151S7K0_CAJCA|nr:Heat shock 70 kDa protein [Cajanus cajan]